MPRRSESTRAAAVETFRIFDSSFECNAIVQRKRLSDDGGLRHLKLTRGTCNGPLRCAAQLYEPA